ncbi:MAG: substrate-binding domain-containing protein [Tannerella sp.]|nr:substrate-binding domain-containing protein [Tannerella sp.]
MKYNPAIPDKIKITLIIKNFFAGNPASMNTPAKQPKVLDRKYKPLHLKHSLTSFRQPCEEIADTSIELMMRRLKDNNRPPVTVMLMGEIVTRESSRFCV